MAAGPTVPGAPQNLIGTATEPTIQLGWSPGGGTVMGLRVDGQVGAGAEVLYAVMGASSTAYQDTSVAQGRTSTYSVAAYNAVVESARSNSYSTVFETNLMLAVITNLVAKPGVLATSEATGGVVSTFLPCVGSILALLLGGAYHGYRQVRKRKVNAALVQGVETARAILETTPQGRTAAAQFVKSLKEHQKEAGVFTTVAGLVENLTDNEAAKLTAQEIAERVELAGQGTATAAVAA